MSDTRRFNIILAGAMQSLKRNIRFEFWLEIMRDFSIRCNFYIGKLVSDMNLSGL
jgi:hypothetical protein